MAAGQTLPSPTRSQVIRVPRNSGKRGGSRPGSESARAASRPHGQRPSRSVPRRAAPGNGFEKERPGPVTSGVTTKSKRGVRQGRSRQVGATGPEDPGGEGKEAPGRGGEGWRWGRPRAARRGPDTLVATAWGASATPGPGFDLNTLRACKVRRLGWGRRCSCPRPGGVARPPAAGSGVNSGRREGLPPQGCPPPQDYPPPQHPDADLDLPGGLGLPALPLRSEAADSALKRPVRVWLLSLQTRPQHRAKGPFGGPYHAPKNSRATRVLSDAPRPGLQGRCGVGCGPHTY